MGMQKQYLLEDALKGLDRMVKSGRFYPEGHPALAAATEEAMIAFRALVADEDAFVFTVRREAILLDDKPLVTENPAVKKMAALLFSRRINRLLIQADVKVEDILTLVRCLALDPATIQARGGIQEVLYRERVTTLWTNEINMEEILAKREELAQAETTGSISGAPSIADASANADADGGVEGGHTLDNNTDKGKEAEEDASAEDQPQPVGKKYLCDLLQALRGAQDDEHYCALLREIPAAVRDSLTAEYRTEIFQALALVCREVRENTLSEERRKVAQSVLGDLCANDLFDYLLDTVCDKSLPEELQLYAQKIAVFLKARIGPRVMHRLVDAEDASARRILTALLSRFGKNALPIAREYLHDERWYVVRNATIVLAELRLQDAVPDLAVLLTHDDVRVRREAVRALTRIGGDQAVAILIESLSGGDDDLIRQSMLSLGAMRSTAAIPAILRLLEDDVSMLKSFELSRDAIRALGEIGAETAVPRLSEIIAMKRFWKRGQLDELRATAAHSLGDIRDDAARQALESATTDRTQSVAQAAHHALKLLNKRILTDD